MWLPDLRCLNEIGFQVVVAMMRRKGLSGVVSALLITVVLVAGFASASYVNMTAVKYNEANMQEALRQARLGSELIRIHIHSTDGSVDSPPRITFVNAWGFESRIKQLVVISRNMSVLATVNLTQPIALPPGSRLTIEPSQIGLGYSSFRELADNIRSIHAYTEAGNSFGSTWGFPREDNMAGRTVAVTYNATTTRVWQVPSVTWMNRTFTSFSYTTLGEIPPIEFATIRARNHYEKAVIGAVVLDGYGGAYGWSLGIADDDTVVEGWPPAPTSYISRGYGLGTQFVIDLGLKAWDGYDSYSGLWRGYGYASWWWKPEDGFLTLEGEPVTAEANTHVVIINRPLRTVVTATINYGSSYCTVSYSLRRVTITPNPQGYEPPQPHTVTRTGMIISFTHTTVSLQTCWSTGCGYTLRFPAASGPVRTAYNHMTGYLLWQGEVLGREHSWDGARLNAPVPTRARTTHYGSGPANFQYYGLRNIDWPYFMGVVQRLVINKYDANDLSAIYIMLPPGNYTVDRYYYVDNVQCNIYIPGPERSWTGGNSAYTPSGRPPPPPCEVYLVNHRESAPPSGGGDSSGGGGGGGGGAAYWSSLHYLLNCR